MTAEVLEDDLQAAAAEVLGSLQASADEMAAALAELAGECGLSVDEYTAMSRAANMTREACEPAARRELQSQRPEVARWADEAETALAAQQARLAPWLELLDAKNRDLAEVNRRLAESGANDDNAALDDWLDADSMRVSLERKAAELVQRIQIIDAALHPVQGDVATAKMDARRMQSKLGALDKAIAHPFASSLGYQTRAGREYLLRSGGWADGLHDQRTPAGPASRDLVMEVLKTSGVGAELQRNVLEARKRVRDDGMIEGNGLVFEPGAPPDFQHTLASAAAEFSALRNGMDGGPRVGLYQAQVPQLQAADISGTPGEFMP